MTPATAVVADTQVLIWYLIDPDRLTADAVTALEDATSDTLRSAFRSGHVLHPVLALIRAEKRQPVAAQAMPSKHDRSPTSGRLPKPSDSCVRTPCAPGSGVKGSTRWSAGRCPEPWGPWSVVGRVELIADAVLEHHLFGAAVVARLHSSDPAE
jgi:hypothetical protein